MRLDAALGAHRPAQQVGVVARAAADGHGDLHELLLEQRHPERPLQHRLERRVLVRDRLATRGAPDVRVHRATLDRAGADERDLDDEVVEAPRLEPGQRADLGPALDLEDADRVGPAQHVVDAGLLLGDRGQRPRLAAVLADQVERVLDGAEHAEAEQVELDQAHPRAVVLVPLQHRAALHPTALDGHHLADRPLGEHHAAGVDAQVPGRLQQVVREVDDGVGHRFVRHRDVMVCHDSMLLLHASCWPTE